VCAGETTQPEKVQKRLFVMSYYVTATSAHCKLGQLANQTLALGAMLDTEQPEQSEFTFGLSAGEETSVRRRRAAEKSTDSSTSFVESLKEIDFYPKVEDEHVVQTESGGLRMFTFFYCVSNALSSCSFWLNFLLLLSLSFIDQYRIDCDHDIRRVSNVFDVGLSHRNGDRRQRTESDSHFSQYHISRAVMRTFVSFLSLWIYRWQFLIRSILT
jgi:hypothetical protein